MASTLFAFGKHRGKTFGDVASDKGYVAWCTGLPNVTGQMKEFVDYARGEGSVAADAGQSVAASLPPSQTSSQTWRPPPAGGSATSSTSAPATQTQIPEGSQIQSGMGWRPTPAVGSTAPAPSSQAGTAPQTVPTYSLAVEIVNRAEFQIAPSSQGAFIPTALWKELSSWPEGRLEEDKKSWRFPLEEYKAVVARFQGALFQQTSVDLPPQWVFTALENSRKAVRASSELSSRLLETFLRELPPEVQAERPVMQFQKEGIQFGITRAGRCLLGDEMGLGKTLQALAIAAQYPDEWPALVVAPSTLRLVWRDQALQWLPHMIAKHQVQVLLKGGVALDPSALLVVTSYDLLARHEKFSSRADGTNYKVVIVDESHYIKDHKSKRTQTLLKICKAAQRVILISGTPALNRAAELHTQLQALLPEVPNFNRYVDRYCDKQTSNFGGRSVVKYVGAKHKAELNALLTGTVMVRRLKKDVLTQLPSKRRQRITLDPGKLNSAAMKEVQAQMSQQQAAMKALAAGGEDGAGAGAGGGALTQTFKRTAEAKIECVCDYVEYLLGEEVKFLLFAHHHTMLDALEAKAKSLNTKYIRIDGKTPMGDRNNRVDVFQQDETCRVAILSITACGQGLTLTAAATVVFAELYWVPGQMLQAEDRAHRIGQTSSVDVQYCIAEGTLDETIFASMNKKQRDTTGILDGAERCMDAWRSSAAPVAPIRESGAPVGPASVNSDASSAVPPLESSPKKRSLEPLPGQQGIAKYFKGPETMGA